MRRVSMAFAVGASVGLAAATAAQQAVSAPPAPVAPETPEAAAPPTPAATNAEAQPTDGLTPIQPRVSDETRPTRAEGGGAPGLTFELRGNAEYTFSGDLRDDQGSVSIARAGLGLGIGAPLGDRARLLLNFEGEWSQYSFTDVSTLLPSGQDPVDDVYLFRFAPGLVYQLTEDLGITGGGLFEVAGESGVNIGDSTTYGGYVGVRHVFSDTFNMTLGVIGKTQLEDNPIFVPLLGLQWKMNDTLMLENDRLGLKLLARVNEQWRVSIFGRYELREYRLNDGGSVPGGVFRDGRVPLGVGFEWRPNERVSVTAYAGVVVYQQYELDNANGDQVTSVETRPAPFIGISGSFAF